MEMYKGKVAIVTGASSGMGEAITVELVKNGMKVVGAARRLDRLNKLKSQLAKESGEFHALACDITQDSQILNVFQWTKKNLGRLDVLVNNAGVARLGSLTDVKTEDMKLALETNVLGLCVATREGVKLMEECDSDGYIININSVSGHFLAQLAVTANVYSASKFTVTALTRTLRLDLAAKKSKIRVTSLSPGYVKTEMLEAAIADSQNIFATTVVDHFRNCPALDAIDVANAVLYLLNTPANVNITELIIQPRNETY